MTDDIPQLWARCALCPHGILLSDCVPCRRPQPPWHELDGGIRETVHALWLAGFDTRDSGDGSKAAAMGCAIDVPHVFVRCDPTALVAEADRLLALVRRWADAGRWFDAPHGGPAVQACYLPADGVAILELYGALR